VDCAKTVALPQKSIQQVPFESQHLPNANIAKIQELTAPRYLRQLQPKSHPIPVFELMYPGYLSILQSKLDIFEMPVHLIPLYQEYLSVHARIKNIP
jgi:hypothetical protein